MYKKYKHKKGMYDKDTKLEEEFKTGEGRDIFKGIDECNPFLLGKLAKRRKR